MSDRDHKAQYVTVQQGEEYASTQSVLAKPPAGELSVPYKTLEGLEGIAIGFRMTVFDLTDSETGEAVGGLATGGGLGNDFISFQWGKEHHACIRAYDLFKAWLATVDPKALEKLP